MTINVSVKEGYQNTRQFWFSQGIFALLYSIIVGFLILPFAFFVAITATILDEDGETEFSGESVLFWISIAFIVFTGIMFVAMLMGTLQHRALEKEKGQEFPFEDALKHPFIEGRFRSYLIFSGYFFLLNAVIGLISWGVSEILGLNESDHDYGVVDIIVNMVSLIVLVVLMSAANLSVLAIANGEATSDAFSLGWKKFYASMVNLFAINFAGLIPLAIPITITALIGVLIDEVSPDNEEDESAGELAIILFLTLIIIIVQLFLLFFAFPLYAAIVARGSENTKSVTPKTVE
jgi:hypothetical protein